MKKRLLALALVAVLALSNAGCGGDAGKTNDVVDTSKEVKLTWYVPMAAHPDSSRIFEKVNEKLKEALNLTVDFVPIEFGNYEAKLQVINAGRGVYDLCYTSNWLNRYNENVRRGSLMDITDILPKYAPEYYAEVPEYFYDALKIDGRIYAVINPQIMARQGGFMYAKSVVDKYNIDLDSIKTIFDLVPYQEQIVKDDPTCNEIGGLFMLAWYGMESVTGDDQTPGVILYDADEKDKYKIVNQYETQEYKDYIKEIARWSKEGLKKSSLLTDSERMGMMYRGGKLHRPFGGLATYKPGGEAEDSIYQGTEVVYSMPRPAVLTTGGATAAMTGVADTSENPERALMLLEYLNKDVETFNTLIFGIEGEHYDLDEDGKIINSGFQVAPYVVGNQFKAKFKQGQADDVWEKTIEINDNAEVSPIYGFVPDFNKYSVQLANCKSVIGEYERALGEGIGDTDKLYKEFIDKLKKAGSDELIAELQAQLDEWVKANK